MFDKISFDDETTLHAWKSELHVINWTKLVIKKSIQTNSRSKSLEKFFTNNIFYQIYNEFSDALILFRGILFYVLHEENNDEFGFILEIKNNTLEFVSSKSKTLLPCQYSNSSTCIDFHHDQLISPIPYY